MRCFICGGKVICSRYEETRHTGAIRLAYCEECLGVQRRNTPRLLDLSVADGEIVVRYCAEDILLTLMDVLQE